MKKFLIGLVIALVFAVALPTITNAQSCRRRAKAKVSRNYAVRGYQAQRPSFYRRHRNVINIAAASGGGALLGGLLGGRRSSMLKGAIVGAGAGALYTFILKPKRRNY